MHKTLNDLSGPLLRITLASALLLIFLGCTKTAGVVTDINASSEGLIVTKCDEIVYWDLEILLVGQGNCRNETVRR